MRTAFIDQLIKEARLDDKIFLVVGDLGYSVIEPFAKEFPDRFLNAGVAEQNMTGIAAGLAMSGYTVLTYSIGNFPTLRCMEQIRYDVCYHNLNVKIVAVGGGYAYGPLGASHHATEEYGMLRTIPNLTVCAPGDPFETRAITSAILKNQGPCYLRLGKAGEPIVHKKDFNLKIGRMVSVIEGEQTAVISTGAMLKYSSDYILDNKLPWGLYSFPYIKPIDGEGLRRIAGQYKKIIVIEEHQKSGGFGSAVLEVMNDLVEKKKLDYIPLIKRVAINDIFVSSANSQQELRNQVQLNFKNT